MTAEEAKRELIKFVHLKTTLEPVFLKVCIEALEKQIPAKPHKSRNEYYCPRCYDDIKTCVGKNHIDGHKKRLDYCFNCGQAIDWSDEK